MCSTRTARESITSLGTYSFNFRRRAVSSRPIASIVAMCWCEEFRETNVDSGWQVEPPRRRPSSPLPAAVAAAGVSVRSAALASGSRI